MIGFALDMAAEAVPEQQVVSEIVLFQIGTLVFAAPVRDVERIGMVRDSPAEELVLDSELGTPFTHQRGVVISSGGRERTLVVDQVVGFRTVPVTDVQPLPAFAAACMKSAALTGLVVLDEIPMPFIDLPTLLREHLARRGAVTP